MKSSESLKTSPSPSLQPKADESQAFFGGVREGRPIRRKPFFAAPLIQAKLAIGEPGDKYEQEADAMAERVTAMSEAPQSAAPAVQGKCADCEQKEALRRQVVPEEKQEEEPRLQAKGELRRQPEEEEEEPVQTKPDLQRQPEKKEEEKEPLQTKPELRRQEEKEEEEEAVQPKLQRQSEEEEEPIQAKSLMRKTTAGQSVASPALTAQLSQSKGSGRPLPPNTQSFMGQAFGADFSGVRVHTDERAAEMNRGLQAKAFTHGGDIYFNRGQYQPETTEGKGLLGHELTHVVQQGQFVSSPFPKIQRWSGGDHRLLTVIGMNQVATPSMLGTKFSDFDVKAAEKLIYSSEKMDMKSEELHFNIIGYLLPKYAKSKKDALWFLQMHYLRNILNAKNHGEGGCYMFPKESAAQDNFNHQYEYEQKAQSEFRNALADNPDVNYFKDIKDEKLGSIFSLIGDALHVAQDRGAHGEGGEGQGHGRQIFEPGYDPDSPAANQPGWREAKKNTVEIFERCKNILKFFLIKTKDSLDSDDKIRNWVRSHESELTGLHTSSKTRMIRILLSLDSTLGWVSEEDVTAVGLICRSVTSRAEAVKIRASIEDDLTSLSSIGQRTQVRFIFSAMP